MKLRTRRGPPQRGNGVWFEERASLGLQPNGKIVMVDYENKEIVCVFYDSAVGNMVESYEWHQLDGSWNDVANQYQVHMDRG